MIGYRHNPEPPDEPEIPDSFLEQARDELNAAEEEPHWTTEDREVIDRAWDIYAEARRQADYDAAEMRALADDDTPY